MGEVKSTFFLKEHFNREAASLKPRSRNVRSIKTVFAKNWSSICMHYIRKIGTEDKRRDTVPLVIWLALVSDRHVLLT